MTTPMRLEIGESYTVNSGWVIALYPEYIMLFQVGLADVLLLNRERAISMLVIGKESGDVYRVLCGGRVLEFHPSMHPQMTVALSRVSSDLPLRP